MPRRLLLSTMIMIFLSFFLSELSMAEEDIDPGPMEFREAVQSQNEEIDPYTGQLKPSYIDVDLPASGELKVQIARIFTSDIHNSNSPPPSRYLDTILGNGWDIHFGRIFFKK